MSTINYSEKIPNNVNLGEDRTLQRALEGWQPNFINWWDDVGPEGSTNHEVYLRTAVSVDPNGWAQFGHVKMRDYRWGIFLNPGDANREIHFGDHKGEKAWQDVPGEHRANLRRIIVTQAATCGPWSTCCTSTLAAMAAKRPRHCCIAPRATWTTHAFWARSTRRRPTGWRSSCSPTSPTVTASSSWQRWPRVPSTRWRAPPSSC